MTRLEEWYYSQAGQRTRGAIRYLHIREYSETDYHCLDLDLRAQSLDELGKRIIQTLRRLRGFLPCAPREEWEKNTHALVHEKSRFLLRLPRGPISCIVLAAGPSPDQRALRRAEHWRRAAESKA